MLKKVTTVVRSKVSKFLDSSKIQPDVSQRKGLINYSLFHKERY